MRTGTQEGSPGVQLQLRTRRSPACGSGNPAILRNDPADRRLCVPAFRQVCPDQEPFTSNYHPRSSAINVVAGTGAKNVTQSRFEPAFIMIAVWERQAAVTSAWLGTIGSARHALKSVANQREKPPAMVWTLVRPAGASLMLSGVHQI